MLNHKKEVSEMSNEHFTNNMFKEDNPNDKNAVVQRDYTEEEQRMLEEWLKNNEVKNLDKKE